MAEISSTRDKICKLLTEMDIHCTQIYSQEGRLDVRDLRKLATLIARYPDNTVGILLLQDHDSLSKKSVQLLDTLRDKNLVTNTLNLHRDLR
ncbi:11625_t:CDS:2, partial [Racocetra fulgida]